jgi:hypothetical protein
VLVFGLFSVGAAVLIREDMRVAPLLIALPVIYVLYFSNQRVMIARNLLFVMPFLAVLAGREPRRRHLSAGQRNTPSLPCWRF